MKTDLFQSCGHCWVFPICWHIERGTFTASSFRIWNSSTGIPSHLLALFVVMLSKAHLASHSRMSGFRLSGNVWREDSYVLSLMSPLSLFKRNSTLIPGTEVIVWGRLGSTLVNILFRSKLLSLLPLSWDMDCVLTLWLTLPLVPLVTVAVRLVFWSLSFPKEVSCTTAYIYS